jgi:hypothetical protein
MEDAATSELKSQSAADIDEETKPPKIEKEKFLEIQMSSGRSGDSDSSDN